MLKKFITALAAIAMMFNMTSCLSEPEQYQTFINQVTMYQVQNGETVRTSGQVEFKIFAAKGRVNLTLPLIVDGKSQQVTFEDLILTFSNTEGYVMLAEKAEAKDSKGKSLGFSVSQLSAQLQITDPNSPTHENVLISFVKDTFNHYATLNTVVHHKTKTTTAGNFGSFDCMNAEYTFRINTEKNTADIIIYGIQFVEQMPTLAEITISAVPLTQTTHGYKLQADAIVPTSTGVPMENRKITNLDINLNLAQGTFNGMFNCMGMVCNCEGDIAFPDKDDK